MKAYDTLRPYEEYVNIDRALQKKPDSYRCQIYPSALSKCYNGVQQGKQRNTVLNVFGVRQPGAAS